MHPGTNDTDVLLIRRWKAGDEQAFAALYQRHTLALHNIAAHKTGDRETARELVQECFISLYEQKDKLSELTPIRSYLYVTLKRRIFNHHRSQLTHQKYALHVSWKHSEQDDSTQLLLETRELEQRLEEEILKLPPQCRLVFTLSRKEYLSNKEIAERLGISEKTVEQHMTKARKTLRTAFGQFLGLAVIAFLSGH